VVRQEDFMSLVIVPLFCHLLVACLNIPIVPIHLLCYFNKYEFTG